MTTDITHQPTPEFRDYLEGEITHAWRRERSFARLRSFVVALACLAAGTTAGLASAQIRESAQRDSLLEAALADLQLAQVRLVLARARQVHVSSQAKAGLVGTASTAPAELELRDMESAAVRAQLNVEEIRATSLPPRDDLNAPVAGSRDFVLERLQLDLLAAQQRLTAAEQAHAEVARQVRVGTVSALLSLDAGLEVVRARAALGTLVERRTLRQEFIERSTPVDELMRRFEQVRLRHDAMVAQEAVKASTQRLDAVRKQHAIGAAAELEVLRAEIQLKERQIELMLLMRQLKDIKTKGT